MGSFFVFPYPPFQFLKLVVIGRWIVAGILSLKRIICLEVLNPDHKTNKSRFYLPVVVLYRRIDVQTASCGCRLFTKRALGAKVFV